MNVWEMILAGVVILALLWSILSCVEKKLSPKHVKYYDVCNKYIGFSVNRSGDYSMNLPDGKKVIMKLSTGVTYPVAAKNIRFEGN